MSFDEDGVAHIRDVPRVAPKPGAFSFREALEKKHSDHPKKPEYHLAQVRSAAGVGFTNLCQRESQSGVDKSRGPTLG